MTLFRISLVIGAGLNSSLPLHTLVTSRLSRLSLVVSVFRQVPPLSLVPDSRIAPAMWEKEDIHRINVCKKQRERETFGRVRMAGCITDAIPIKQRGKKEYREQTTIYTVRFGWLAADNEPRWCRAHARHTPHSLAYIRYCRQFASSSYVRNK